MTYKIFGCSYENPNKITTLNWSSMGIEEIPDGVFTRFPNVEVINLDENRLKKLPNDITSLSKLRILRLNNNNLTSLPPLHSQTFLTEVNLTFNNLTYDSFPHYLNQLPKMKNLYGLHSQKPDLEVQMETNRQYSNLQGTYYSQPSRRNVLEKGHSQSNIDKLIDNAKKNRTSITALQCQLSELKTKIYLQEKIIDSLDNQLKSSQKESQKKDRRLKDLEKRLKKIEKRAEEDYLNLRSRCSVQEALLVKLQKDQKDQELKGWDLIKDLLE